MKTGALFGIFRKIVFLFWRRGRLWTLLPSPVTSTTGCCFCFGSVSSFVLKLFLHWSPVAYWAPTDLGSSLLRLTLNRKKYTEWSKGWKLWWLWLLILTSSLMIPNGIRIASVMYFLIILSSKQVSGYIKKIFCGIAIHDRYST